MLFSVRYDDVVPDTFSDERGGGCSRAPTGRTGSSVAHTVLTKCGSRYEAAEEELAA